MDILSFVLYWLIPSPFAIWYSIKFSKSYKEITGIRVAGFVVAWFVPFFNWVFVWMLLAALINKYKKN